MSSAEEQGSFAVGLTLLLHPDLGRVGEVAYLFDLGERKTAALGRTEPVFRSETGARKGALESALISRAPVQLHGGADGVRLDRAGSTMDVRVGGAALEHERLVAPSELERGVVLELGKTVVLLLHTLEHAQPPADDLGLVGHSGAIRALRDRIGRAARGTGTVLLLGETGTGKELVAHALHRSGARSGRPYVAVNVAAIPLTVAEAELFGHAKGAFTGAQESRDGYFAQADGGTLFLDEIGEASLELQAKLLRVLETGEVPVVGGKPRKVDVRVIAATDADLEQAVAQGRFRRPLLERLRGQSMRVPPLRERPDDLARLFVHFLRAELQACDQLARLAPPDVQAQGFIPTRLFARLLAHPWPGNVRELRNVVRQLVAANPATGRYRLDAVLDAQLAERPQAAGASDPPPREPVRAPPAAASASERPRRRRPASLSDAEIVAALERNGYNQRRTCDELDVSRTWLHTRLERCEGVRTPKELGADEIRHAAQACAGDLERMAALLRVSPRGLSLRMTQLGVT